MNILSIRGAITIEENTRECIIKSSEDLLKEVLEQNDISNDDIINIIFSTTQDITKAYPAIATRNLGITDCAIMCMQELNIEGGLPKCIRLMMTVNTNKTKKDIKHIYLKEAKKLRPDISMQENPISVAIDGPAGSGKSTVSKIITKELNFTYIDTGAMFRAVAYYCLKNNLDYNDFEKISQNLDNIEISLGFENGLQQIYLNRENISEKIRTPEISSISAIVAKIPEVREKLLVIQREAAKNKNIIMDGRDVGTNILPEATVKIYLDAEVEERAKRRCEELALKGKQFDYQEIISCIKERDFLDINREIAPLLKANDAIVIDTTNVGIQEVAQQIIKIIKQSIK